MKTIAKKTFTEIVLLIVLGLTCCCVAACGSNEEEKKIKVEDTTPPVISNVKVFDITATSAQVSWETDEPAVSELAWGTTNDIKESKWIMHGEFTTTRSFNITGLVPSTLYYCWALSSDGKNPWRFSEPFTFTTLAK